MSSDRVIALIDMDCFYVQCEQRLAPNLWSHPCAVAQYNSWKGGGLIAVNYEARSYGVKRGMRGNDAIALCPDLHIFSVPEVRGKADLNRYREASEEVFEAIKQLVTNLDQNIVVEKASVDEAFVDLTKYVDQMIGSSEPLPRVNQLVDTKLEMGSESDLNKWLNEIIDTPLMFDNEIRLVFGAVVVQEIRKEILNKTQFKCSAGISHNKMLAKLGCALNKPNAQTILPKNGIDQLFMRTDISKVRSLGGKLGSNVKTFLKISNMFELKCLEFNDLAKHFDQKTAKWLKDMANGLDDEPVTNRQVSKSLGCGKNFPGKTALSTLEDVRFWIKQLTEELVERMTRDKEVNKRSPKLMTIGFKLYEKDHNSRSLPLDSNSSAEQLTKQIMKEVFNKIKFEPIVNLSIAASKFVEECDDPSYNTLKLDNYFQKVDKRPENGTKEAQNITNGEILKSVHTKTLNDFWKASTSGHKCNHQSNGDIPEVISDQSIDLKDNKEKQMFEPLNKVYNPWNCSPFQMTSFSRKISSMNTSITDSTDDNKELKESLNDCIVVDKESEIITEDRTVSESDISLDNDIKIPVKRGFFYRKMLEFKEQEKAAQEKRIQENIDDKNVTEVKRRRESEPSEQLSWPFVDITGD